MSIPFMYFFIDFLSYKCINILEVKLKEIKGGKNE